MTVKLVVLYTNADDNDSFDRHYLDIHVPLVQQIPGLERFEAGRFTAALDGGEQAYHRIAELYFASPEAMQAGFASAEGQATADDYAKIAPPGSRMFVVAADD